MAFCAQASDKNFGPAVESCRRDFDFTLLFEQSILSLPVSSAWLLFASWRLYRLLRRPIQVGGRPIQLAKFLVALSTVGLQLALLVFWSRARTDRTRASIPSSALSLLVQLLIASLSVQEHSKSFRPSAVICSYLILSLLLDLPQLRTLWLINTLPIIAAVFSANFGLRCLLLLLECTPKTKYIFDVDRKSLGPSQTCGIISRSFFWWLTPLIYKGYKEPLQQEDLYPNPADFSSEDLGRKLYDDLQTTSETSKHAFLIVTARNMKKGFLAPMLPRLCAVGLALCQPLLLKRLITYIDSPDSVKTKNVGYGLMGAYVVVYLGLAISNAWYTYLNGNLITRFRGAVVSMIYSCTMDLSVSAVEKASSITIMNADVERIVNGMRHMHELWAGIIQVAIGSYLLERQTGVAVIMPIAVAAGCGFMSIKIAAAAGMKQMAWMKKIERRIDVTANMLSSMRGVKMSGLSELLGTIIQALRVDELKAGSAFRLYQIFSMLLGPYPKKPAKDMSAADRTELLLAFTPMFVSPTLTFAVFIAISHRNGTTLDTARVFTALSLLSLISSPLTLLCQIMPLFSSMLGCFSRIEAFARKSKGRDYREVVPWRNEKQDSSFNLNGERSSDEVTAEKEHADSSAENLTSIRISNADFGWKADSPALRNINLAIPTGRLTMVIGPVGCGKSTLLKAILGEAAYCTGIVCIPGISTSYCDQSPWILNETFKENIIGFSEYDETWYLKVIRACVLNEDIKQLPNGEQSKLGSKGITISGGQKQRLSLARAIYSRAQLNVLDDVLSGLDGPTERKVWHRVFGRRGILRSLNATVVLATHSVRFLPNADHIISVSADGTISEQGTYASLANAGGYVQSLDIPHPEEFPELDMEEPAHIFLPKTERNSIQARKATLRTKSTGVYRYYAGATGTVIVAVYLSLPLLQAFLQTFPNIWAKWWSDENAVNPGHDQAMYLGIYALLNVSCILVIAVIAWFGLVTVIKRAGASLHMNVLRTVLGAPLSFFDKTDTGTIINRFSQDMQLIDMELPTASLNIVLGVFSTTGQVLVIMFVSYYVAISFPVIFAVLYLLQRVYLRTSRQLRLLDLESKSPLYTQFLETLDGLATIRAFSWGDSFRNLNHERLVRSQQPFYLLYCVQRWLALVLDCMMTGFVLLIIGIIIALQGRVSAGFAGVALTNIITLSNILSNLVSTWTLLETSIGSVERIKNFEKDTPSEDNPEKETYHPPSYWPKRGAIQLLDVSASYNSGETLALKSVNLLIRSGEKIGVCGRTGSGKTSLMLSLFRLLELTEGRILIDGTDIATVPCNRVRSILNAIPQEPYFLSGSIRSNASPHSVDIPDEEIREALTKVHLWPIIEAKGGLDTPMHKDTLSHGERQLFCLARAMLKKKACRIVVLDEATGSIDILTEKLLQKTIKAEFEDCTVVTIAHRLDTIMDSDKIAVMDNGRLVEYDTPEGLLGRDSVFKGLWDAQKGREAHT